MDSVTTEVQQGVGIHVRLEGNGAGNVRNGRGKYVSFNCMITLNQITNSHFKSQLFIVVHHFYVPAHPIFVNMLQS